MEKIYKTALYLRLSREDSDKNESESIVNQKKLLEDYVHQEPDLIVEKHYIDDGYSGTRFFDRPAFNEMMEDVKKGIVDCIVVKDLSRFGRNHIETGNYLEQVFPLLGVRFIAINDNVDTVKNENQMSGLLIPFKNLINDSYCMDLSKKIKSVMTAKKKNGEFIGGMAPYGYMLDPDDKTKLIINPETAPVVRDIFLWYINGMSKCGMIQKLNGLKIPSPAKYRIMNYKPNKKHNKEYAAKILKKGLWSMDTLNSILQKPTYAGHLTQNTRTNISYKLKKQVRIPKEDWIIVKNTHEPIVTDEEFNLVQDLLKRKYKACDNKAKVHRKKINC